MTKKTMITPSGQEVIDMTPDEEAQLTADKEADIIQKADEKTAEDARVANKDSAKAKLIAGEALTEAEADTIVL